MLLSSVEMHGIVRELWVVTLLSSLAWAAPDAIYVNGKIVTVDTNFSITEAIAVTG